MFVADKNDTFKTAASFVYNSTTSTVYTVVANNTELSRVQLRNVYAGTSDLTAGTTALTTGVIYYQYEA
jgi:hypothetical protein